MQHQYQAFLDVTDAILIDQALGLDVNAAFFDDLQHRELVPIAEATGLLDGHRFRGRHQAIGVAVRGDCRIIVAPGGHAIVVNFPGT